MTRAALFCLAFLAGCTVVAPRPASTPDTHDATWQARQLALQGLSHWTLEGRLAVQHGQEGAQARIHWAQTGTDFELRIIAPLSQGTYVLRGGPHGVALIAPDNQVYRAPDLATLMTTHLHWALPVAGARYWVLGIPDPTQPVDNLRLDVQGRLSDLAQAGWRVSILDYQTSAGRDLPRKLFILRKDVQLRLVITQWALALN